MRHFLKKLPKSLLTDSEWDTLNKIFIEAEDPKDRGFRKTVLDHFAEIAKERCVGDDEHVCLQCGAEQHHVTGLCEVCRKALRDRGTLRGYGRAHGYSIKGAECEVCGRPGYSSGLCRSCYEIKRKHGFETIEEVRQFRMNQTSKRNKGKIPVKRIKELGGESMETFRSRLTKI